MKNKLSNSISGKELSQLHSINYRRGPFYLCRRMQHSNRVSVPEYKKEGTIRNMSCF
jgi:hypothetical protein